MKTPKTKKIVERKAFIIKKLWPVLVSLSGAIVVALTFFIPSVQDQWDRYQSRKVIQQYEEVGNDLFAEKRYLMAEQAYAKAFELSEEKRLDIEVKRLSAKINSINTDPEWGSKPPEGLEEVDFQFLLHFMKGNEMHKQRASIYVAYGIYLASIEKTNEAKSAFHEAIRLDSAEVHAYINLGNLLDQEGEKAGAEKCYLKAIKLDSKNGKSHYNLGLLYLEQGRMNEAEEQFAKTIVLDSTDVDAIREYNLLKKENQ